MYQIVFVNFITSFKHKSRNPIFLVLKSFRKHITTDVDFTVVLNPIKYC